MPAEQELASDFLDGNLKYIPLLTGAKCSKRSTRNSSEGARSDSCKKSPVDHAAACQSIPVAWSGSFSSQHGGTVTFVLPGTSYFVIAVLSLSSSSGEACETPSHWIGVRVGRKWAELVCGTGSELRVLSSRKTREAGYSSSACGASWLSFDAQDRCLKYGKGSCMRESTVLSYRFDQAGVSRFTAAEKQSIRELFGPLPNIIQLQYYAGPPVLEHSVYEMPMVLPALKAREVASVTLDSEPLRSDPSPRLTDVTQLAPADFAHLDYTFTACLPPVAQALAGRVRQLPLRLDGPPSATGHKLAAAIEYSLATPGCYLYTKLAKKLAKLPAGMTSHQAHITVALAPCKGRSPGPPLTLEILPPGHSTPVHDNGNSYGVLRVLHGSLNVALFNSGVAEADPSAPLDEVDLDFEDMMWFSPRWYQTHAMHNRGSSFCSYLLGRQYAEDDFVRWPEVQYKGAQKKACSQDVKADCASLRELHSFVMAELQQAMLTNPMLLASSPLSSETSLSRTQAWVEDTTPPHKRAAFPRIASAIQQVESSRGHLNIAVLA